MGTCGVEDNHGSPRDERTTAGTGAKRGDVTREAWICSLSRLAKTFGLCASGWRLDIDGLQESCLPAILFVENTHFVVLDRVCNQGDLEIIIDGRAAASNMIKSLFIASEQPINPQRRPSGSRNSAASDSDRNERRSRGCNIGMLPVNRCKRGCL